VPLLKATQGRPTNLEKVSSSRVRFGPTVESQLLANAACTCASSVPPMCGTDSKMRVGVLAEGTDIGATGGAMLRLASSVTNIKLRFLEAR
jgi:hypothetical protein